MPSIRLPFRRAVAAACLACAAGAAEADPTPPAGGAASPTSGLASFYSQRLAGRATASGAPYDPAALTAAHRSLPLGTRLRVVNPENDRSVVVTVNDRGPALRKRLIDLSAAAAHALGIRSSGVARVETHIVERNETRVVEPGAIDALRPALAAATDALSIAPFARH